MEDILEKALQGKLSYQEAADLLGVWPSTFQRYLEAYQAGIEIKTTPGPAPMAKNEKAQSFTIRLYKHERQLLEQLAEQFQCSKTEVVRMGLNCLLG